MATKVTIDGKEYCVETLLHEVKRLKRELTIQAEDNRQFKIGMLIGIKSEIGEREAALYEQVDEKDAFGFKFCMAMTDHILQEKINLLKGEDSPDDVDILNPCPICGSTNINITHEGNLDYRSYYIQCECGLTLGAVHDKDDLRKLIDFWNNKSFRCNKKNEYMIDTSSGFDGYCPVCRSSVLSNVASTICWKCNSKLMWDKEKSDWDEAKSYNTLKGENNVDTNTK